MREVTAVDDEFGAGDEAAGFVGGEEDAGADEFVAFAEALHRSVAPNCVGARGGGAVFFEEKFLVLLGGKEAGGDRVDADAAEGPLAG